MALDTRRERFCREYLIDLNGAAAARRIGIAEGSARSEACRMLAESEVQAFLAQLKAEQAERLAIDADYVLGTIRETVERCRQAEPVRDRKGEQVWVENREGDIVPAFTFDSKGVLKGCELLGRHLALFNDKLDLKATVQLTEMSEDEIKAELAALTASGAIALLPDDGSDLV
jgi:phage terminase small subunit